MIFVPGQSAIAYVIDFGAFFKELGLDPARIGLARPLTAPDEYGAVLFQAAVRLAGTLLSPEAAKPRPSAEYAGLSLIVTGDRSSFSPALPFVDGDEIEMRFVLSLPFDPAFFREG